MNKFKKGDRVRYRRGSPVTWTGEYEGLCGTVMDDYERDVRIRFDGMDYCRSVLEVNLEALSRELGGRPAWTRDAHGLASAASPSKDRKETPIYSGPMSYFPLALAAVARLCFKGNDKHNPGQPLHWSRGKSQDHKDCIARHLLEAGTMDEEFDELHDVALAWRALANLQLAEEKRLGITQETK